MNVNGNGLVDMLGNDDWSRALRGDSLLDTEELPSTSYSLTSDVAGHSIAESNLYLGDVISGVSPADSFKRNLSVVLDDDESSSITQSTVGSMSPLSNDLVADENSGLSEDKLSPQDSSLKQLNREDCIKKVEKLSLEWQIMVLKFCKFFKNNFYAVAHIVGHKDPNEISKFFYAIKNQIESTELKSWELMGQPYEKAIQYLQRLENACYRAEELGHVRKDKPIDLYPVDAFSVVRSSNYLKRSLSDIVPNDKSSSKKQCTEESISQGSNDLVADENSGLSEDNLSPQVSSLKQLNMEDCVKNVEKLSLEWRVKILKFCKFFKNNFYAVAHTIGHKDPNEISKFFYAIKNQMEGVELKSWELMEQPYEKAIDMMTSVLVESTQKVYEQKKDFQQITGDEQAEVTGEKEGVSLLQKIAVEYQYQESCFASKIKEAFELQLTQTAALAYNFSKK
jgi:hypothetical protein